ncbi:uncharacterized protein CCOS01_10793 [Colletotrichum costaricense]|uniref:Uncharacterized protein n=2 Tax=Colletotrichum acutatum species complex TaxID=2707335 RepID=A0AAI9YS45_9PEZI|nr:uncharacterized protein CCOS01_10793 [Colletotrichum costaricense]XP_060373663.1 uncharacterized protein CTAM01_15779 [Colletotrichum tamarilloi]KAI3551867.1 hypothetical protein CSPX01_00543 [Colletotrichum filicis]KAK1474998.1 hypothetical protein CTAM01_15779 [Colletotrichum tamarilloi]KAK1520674.1 hypothetical protein CCOS01_10793 [Colletotrichum costaricense]
MLSSIILNLASLGLLSCLGTAAAALQSGVLFQANITTGQQTSFGPGPKGTRLSIPILGGTLTGSKLSGEVLSIGADWGLFDSKGTFNVDAYYQIRTNDGVDIFAHSQGPSQPDGRILTHITLETGNDEYYWVNNIAIAGITTVGNDFIVIEAYQLTPDA